MRQRWRKRGEEERRHEIRDPRQVFLDDQHPVTIVKKGLRNCRDIDLFSAFFPERVGAEEVGKIVVYAHLAELAQDVVDDAIRRYNLGYSGKVAAAGASPVDPVPRGSVITIKPDIPGLRFEVAEARLALWESIQAVELRFLPEAPGISTICRGWLTIWLDCLRLADLQVSIFVALDSTPEVYRQHLSRANARPYRRVFPSYSHEDKEIVEHFQAYAHSFGDKYLRDVMEFRAGERWEPKILEFIRQADVFQLFWSERALKSDYVKFEWQKALEERERRPDPYFLRPCYWSEKPATPIPVALQEIHFAKIPRHFNNRRPLAIP